MQRYAWMILVFLVSFIVSGYMQAHATTVKDDETTTITEPINDDTVITGNSIKVDAIIGGELVATGQDITISRKPFRSLIAAGNSVKVDDGIGYNGFLAGNMITIKGTVDHDLYVAGNSITIDPSANIKGSLRVAGSNLKLSGTIGGDVYFGAETLESDAKISGTLKGGAEKISFTGGSIGKDFLYKSNNDAQGLDKVTISGKTERTPLPKISTQRTIKFWLWGLLSIIISGAALILLTPKKLQDIHHTFTTHWTQALLYGVATLVLAPVVIGILMATWVGIPLALVTLCGYFVVLYFSFIIGHIVLGRMLVKRASSNLHNWWIALGVGALLVSLVRLIPYLGAPLFGVFFIAVTIPVIGAEVLWWRNKLTE